MTSPERGSAWSTARATKSKSIAKSVSGTVCCARSAHAGTRSLTSPERGSAWSTASVAKSRSMSKSVSGTVCCGRRTQL